MQIDGTYIDDTFAEAFRMHYARLIVTAADEYWLDAGVREFCGYSTSVIGCDAEIGVEQSLAAADTPDGRPGKAILAFGFSADALAGTLPNRVGQCLMTAPTCAVYDGLAPTVESGPTEIPLGKHLRFFGDGYQKSKLVAGCRYWRIPVMDGEFLVAEKLRVAKGVGGGNIILQSATQQQALSAARRASQATGPLAGVITPFPGGIARSGSKVGSRYKKLKASTAEAYCPALRGRVETRLADGVNCAYEIVIDGAGEQPVAAAMAAAIRAAAGPDVLAISAGNYGGKLGKFHFHLREMLERSPANG